MYIINHNNLIIKVIVIDTNIDQTKILIILGCGGHSKVVTDVAEAVGFKNIFYLDKNFKESFLGKKVFKNIEENFNGYFFVAIGDNLLREKVYRKFSESHIFAKGISLIHPTSFFSKKATIQEGSIVMPLCVVNAGAKISKGVIVNSATVVEHDVCLSEFCSLAPRVVIGGNTFVGIRSAISIGATISNGINIGNDVIVGGSSFVLKNINSNIISYGVPAKTIKKNSKR